MRDGPPTAVRVRLMVRDVRAGRRLPAGPLIDIAVEGVPVRGESSNCPRQEAWWTCKPWPKALAAGTN